MSEPTTKVRKPPSSRSKSSGAPLSMRQGAQAQPKGKAGRPSFDDYAKRVCQALRMDSFQLDECSALGQLPGVQVRVRQQPQALLPVGTALRSVLDEAVGDVERLAKITNATSSQRIAAFLQVWYREHGTVVRVAQALGLSRTYVAHEIQPRALGLVSRRFLELVWRTQASE